MKYESINKRQTLVYIQPQLVELGDAESIKGYHGQYQDGAWGKTDQY